MAKRKVIEAWQIEDAARLKSIFDARFPKISQLKFGEEFDIGTQGMVWQYLTGTTPLNIDAAVNFARGLRVPIDAFSETLARKIAEAYQLTVEGKKSSNPLVEVFHQLTKNQQDAVMTIISSYGVTLRNHSVEVSRPVEITSSGAKQSSSSGS